jgi:N-acetylglutamate synthase-like GNAT family acetyltransferase
VQAWEKGGKIENNCGEVPVSKLWASKQQDKEWITSSTFEKIENRESLKEACNRMKTRAAKQATAAKYRETLKRSKGAEDATNETISTDCLGS